MVHINCNQTETKRRPGQFNFFSHIIWFYGARKAQQRGKDEKELKLHGEKKVQRLCTYTLHPFSTAVDRADDLY